MAFPTFPSAHLAVNIPNNPVSCDREACHNPAVLVLEAVVPDTTSDTGRKHWAICEDVTCLNWAQTDADTFDPIDTDLRWATVTELAELSGLEIPVAA
jgi:hypothetical protein